MPNSNIYSGFRYPSEIISHAVWLYFRFSLRFRDVEEMLASRGIIVTYETIRQWTLKFGQTCANTLRRKQAKRGDKWLREQLKPEAALGKAFATNATFLLRCKSSRFRHFAHFELAI